MTEDEAKTKWCPHKRVAIIKHDWSEITTGHNQIELDGEPGLTKDAVHYRCIASACMAWRWNEGIHFWGNAAGGFCSTVGDENPPEGFVIRKGSKDSLDGYCGLAGRP